MEPQVKKSWESKTLWIAAINAVAALFVPAVQHFITDNPEAYAAGLSVLFAVLRKVTKGSVSIK